ncbi:hypothetical protein KDA_05860 [Dictyobacter alpinus]|uniref:DUF505 domain-containing protein n=1 Tax=Dictyobacter alpinus TaxID=2014873 RepID=A0A402B182_9CHLR|nr:hypothetical protein KDA_05860 [Dictyobacter alpinus]
MDLLTWSSPDRTTYALTTLGQAAYEAVLKEGYPVLDEVLNEAIMTVLAQFIDQGRDALTPEQLFNLQMLGYVDGEEKITAAGQAAMRAYSLLQQEVEEPSRTFAITEPELELLATLHSISDPSSTRPQPPPDKQALHKIFVDRMVQHYQQFIGRYGRDFKGKLAKKQRAVAMLEQLKDHDKWFNTFWDLDELLVSLAAFDLVRPEPMDQKTVYNITPNGQRIVEAVGRGTNDISATGVKVLTSAITRLHSPADLWVEQARDEGLIGTKGGITKEGHLFADLAEHCTRLPALTRDEAEMLKNLPQIINDIASPAEKKTQQDEGKQRWALEKLEARVFIECLVDGQIVRTPIGQLLVKAISGAMHLGHPVTPSIVRLVAAIRQIGTLYVKERKVRIVPENWAEIERLTGLGPQEFKEVRHVARMAQYIGEVTITEAGLDLLMIMDQLNKQIETSSAKSVPSSGGTLTV